MLPGPYTYHNFNGKKTTVQDLGILAGAKNSQDHFNCTWCLCLGKQMHQTFVGHFFNGCVANTGQIQQRSGQRRLASGKSIAQFRRQQSDRQTSIANHRTS